MKTAMLTFRAAREDDLPLLRHLAEKIWRGSYEAMITAEQIDYMLAWMYSEEAIRAELAAGIHWEIASWEDHPAGYLALEFPAGSIAHLHKLYLTPELQGRGLGQTMLARVCQLATERGAREIRLRVNKSNTRALRAYTRAGFHIIECLIADIGGGYVMDDYILTRPL